MKSKRDQLIDWIDLFSVSSGEEFTLSSGEKSNVYVDIKKTAFHYRAGRLLVELLHDKMFEKFSPVHTVAGVVLGGCHLASSVAMHHPLGLNVIYVRKESKNHGTKQLIEKPANCYWDNVILIEDVLTTGASALQAADLLREAKFNVRGILAVIDRRIEKEPFLGSEYPVESLINFEELHP